MASENEIRARLATVLQGNASVWVFHSWLQDVSWNLPRDSALSLRKLVGNVLSRFDNYYEGALNEEQLLSELGYYPVIEINAVSAMSSIQVPSYFPLFKLGAFEPVLALV